MIDPLDPSLKEIKQLFQHQSESSTGIAAVPQPDSLGRTSALASSLPRTHRQDTGRVVLRGGGDLREADATPRELNHLQEVIDK